MRAPAFQEYAVDEIARRLGLSLEEDGATGRLERYIWSQSEDQYSIVNEDKMLAGILGVTVEEWARLREGIFQAGRKLFVQQNGRLISVRLKEQALKQRKYRKTQAENGRAGGLSSVKRRLSGRLASAEPMPSSPTPTPTPTPASELRKEKEGEKAVSAPPATADIPTKKSAVKMADAEFIASLKTNPAYDGIDIDREIGKLQAWLLTPKGAGKKMTRQRLVNWLNKCDKPMGLSPAAFLSHEKCKGFRGEPCESPGVTKSGYCQKCADLYAAVTKKLSGGNHHEAASA